MPATPRCRRRPYCPKCKSQVLDPIMHGRVEIDACRRCGGLWFEAGELDRIISVGDETRSLGHLLTAAENDMGEPTHRGCADCGRTLRRSVLRSTGIAIEQCRDCGGIWLEKGALEHLEQLRATATELVDVERDPTRAEWQFEFLLGLPVAFNIKPRRFPVVTAALLVLNVVAFALTSALGGVEQVLDPFALVAADFPTAKWWTSLVTHQFTHAGLLHLVGNMYFLYLFGNNVEDALGRPRYLAFYLICGGVAGLVQTVSEFDSEIAMVGASGAVAGIGAAYTVIFRRAKITMMIWIWQYKISVVWYFLIWVIFNLMNAAVDAPGVGWFAHLGGFAAGLAMAAALYGGILAVQPSIRYVNEEGTRRDRGR